jgi:hypothetical protein
LGVEGGVGTFDAFECALATFTTAHGETGQEFEFKVESKSESCSLAIADDHVHFF